VKRIALLAEFTPPFPPHPATMEALRHSCDALGVPVEATWVSTADIEDTLLNSVAGISVAPRIPYRDMERTLRAIRYA
jgi:CTP synthase (UTP-ammonia lyase)